LHTHGTDGRIGNGVGDTGDINVECTNAEVGVSGSRGDEALEGVGGRVICPNRKNKLSYCSLTIVDLGAYWRRLEQYALAELTSAPEAPCESDGLYPEEA